MSSEIHPRRVLCQGLRICPKPQSAARISAWRGPCGSRCHPPILCPAALRRQKEHLVFERVCGERPAVTEDDGLPRAPVFVVDLRPVVGGDRGADALFENTALGVSHDVPPFPSLRLTTLAG